MGAVDVATEMPGGAGDQSGLAGGLLLIVQVCSPPPPLITVSRYALGRAGRGALPIHP